MNKLIIIAVVFLLIAVVILLRRRNKRLQDRHYEAEKHQREDALKQSLINPEEWNQKSAMGEIRPYKVSYSAEGSGTGNNGMLEIIERTERFEKKYMFSSSQNIYFYIRSNNTIALAGDLTEGDGVACIYSNNHNYCIKAIGKNNIQIRRGKASALVDRSGVVLNNRDTVVIRGAEYLINFV